MRRALIAAVCLLLLSAGHGGAGAVAGGRAEYLQPIHPTDDPVPVAIVEFQGGERACVIVEGDHKPVMDLELYVLDQQRRVVAKDTDGGDFCAAIWYPPKTAKYIIAIHNKGNTWNQCWISVK